MQNQVVLIFIAATGKYFSYTEELIASAEKYFLPGIEKLYVVCTDNQSVAQKINVFHHYTPHLPWPLGTLLRYHHYLRYIQKNESFLNKFNINYIYHIDADVLFVNKILPEDVFHKLIGVQHCGYTQAVGPVEKRKQSACFTPICNTYFGGSFTGGDKENYINFIKNVVSLIDADLKNNIIPTFHDESVINYIFNREYPTILPISFHYPGHNAYLMNMLKNNEINPKIMLLEKNNPDEFRK